MTTTRREVLLQFEIGEEHAVRVIIRRPEYMYAPDRFICETRQRDTYSTGYHWLPSYDGKSKRLAVAMFKAIVKEYYAYL